MNPSSPIYLDNHATTPTDPRVAQVVLKYMTEEFGNASSVDHTFGDRAQEAVEKSKEQIRSLVGGHRTDRIIFTSGATESINLALKGLLLQYRELGANRPLRFGLLPLEHPAVLDTIKHLVDANEAEAVFFKVDQKGRLDLDNVRLECDRGLDVVSVMAAQNEIGNIYPLAEVAMIAKEKGALLFTDATQAAGKTEIKFDEWNIDLLAFSAHKIYGPKGVGALVISDTVKIQPLVHGGAHQGSVRSGTLNVPGIVGFGEACKLREREASIDESRVASLRDRLESALLGHDPNFSINGDFNSRLAGNLNVSLNKIPNTAIIGRLRTHLAISTGSACSSGIEAPSYILRAMGLSSDRLASALRFGVGKFNTSEQISRAIYLLTSAINDIKMSLRPETKVSQG